MPGPAADPNAIRRKHNPFEVIEGEIIEEKPELPRFEIGLEGELTRWHPEVLRSWDAIWASPMRREYTEVDLSGMHAAMMMLNQFYIKPNGAALNNYRLWCKEFGFTPMARRQAHITIGPKSVPTPGSPEAPKQQKSKRADPRKRHFKAAGE